MGQKSFATVLIVDDEPLTRMYAAGVMQDAGFKVLEAGDSDEAWEILASRHDLRAAFVDVRIPGSRDGIALVKAISEQYPQIKVILTSAYEPPSPADVGSASAFVPKPYVAEDIARLISR